MKNEELKILIASVAILFTFWMITGSFDLHVLFYVLSFLWMPLWIINERLELKCKVLLCLGLFIGGSWWYYFFNKDGKGFLNFLVIYLIAIAASLLKSILKNRKN